MFENQDADDETSDVNKKKSLDKGISDNSSDEYSMIENDEDDV